MNILLLIFWLSIMLISILSMRLIVGKDIFNSSFKLYIKLHNPKYNKYFYIMYFVSGYMLYQIIYIIEKILKKL